jgi:hypothetical protein
MASVCRSCHHLVPSTHPDMPSPERLMSLRPHLIVVVDALAEYTASANDGEGLLFDAQDEHEVILGFLRWLEFEVGKPAPRRYSAPAGRPGDRVAAG